MRLPKWDGTRQPCRGFGRLSYDSTQSSPSLLSAEIASEVFFASSWENVTE